MEVYTYRPQGVCSREMKIYYENGIIQDFEVVGGCYGNWKIYRSGETGYFINKTPCRLKDILELFMDTGIGKDGYSIIGQGKIDEILSKK